MAEKEEQFSPCRYIIEQGSQEEFLYRAACAPAVLVVNKVLKKSMGCFSCRLAVSRKPGRML